MAKQPKTSTTPTSEPEDVDATPTDDSPEVTFDYLGVTFQIPKLGDDWDSNAWISLLRGADYQAAEFQLNATEQWKVATALAPTRGELKKFVRVFREAVREGCDFS